MLLFYIRHGDPIYDPDSLTPLGEQQAEAISKRLALYGVDKIYSSTSNRAIQTALPTSQKTKKEIIPLDFCHEQHVWEEFTVWSEKGYRTWAFCEPNMKRIFAQREASLCEKWYENERFSSYNFKAGVKRVNECVDAWLEELGYKHIREEGAYKVLTPSQERVALFAHEGFGMSFLSSVLDIPYPAFCTRFGIGHSDMTVIEFREEGGMAIPKVLTFSNDGHLYRENLSTQHNYGVTF